MAARSPFNIVEEVYNNTNTPISFERSVTASRAIIDNPQEFNLAITKLIVPVSSIESFRFDPSINDDNARYYFSLIGSSLLRREEREYRTIMPDHSDDDADHSYGPVRYYSPDGVLEIISRMMYGSYLKYIMDFADNDTFYDTAVFDFDVQSPVSGNVVATAGINIVPHATSRVADVSLEFERFEISAWYNGSGQPTELYKTPFTVTIKSPDNITCVVLAQAQGSDFNLRDSATHSVEFTEAAYNSQSGGIPYNALETRTIRLLPCETLTKFRACTSVQGTWTITVNGFDATMMDLRMIAKLKVVMTPNSYPNRSPTISLDSANKLKLSYTTDYQRTSTKICFSRFLNNICNMGARFTRYNSTFSCYEFLYQPYNFSVTENADTLSFTQYVSTRYLLTNMIRIVAKTNMPVERENTGGVITSDVLCDFSVDTSDMGLGLLTYSTDASYPGPWRMYEFTSSNPLKTYDFSIFVVYASGEQIQATIPCGQSGVCRLTMFPRKDRF